MNVHILQHPTSRKNEILSRRRLLHQAMLTTAWLLLIAASAFFPSHLLAAEGGASSTNQIAMKAGHFLDVVRGEVVERQVILVECEVIKSVGAEGSVTIPGNATVLDFSQAWVLPGLIDCHTHITAEPEDYYADIFRRTPIDVATTSHIYARRTLEAGFTTCRNLGADEFTDVALSAGVPPAS